MLKRLMLFVAIFVLLSFAACAEQPKTEASNTVQPTETSVLTPTPVRTLSAEEIANVQKYNELMNYCKDYNDWNAAVEIYEMHNNNQITAEEYSTLFSIDTFSDAKDFNEDLWTQLKGHLEKISGIINEQTQNPNESDKQNAFQYLCEAARNKTDYITLLDTEEKRDRVIQGIAYFDNWYNEQTEENFQNVKDIYFSQGLSAGDILLMCSHMYYYIDNESVISFLNEQGVMEYANTQLESL